MVLMVWFVFDKGVGEYGLFGSIMVIGLLVGVLFVVCCEYLRLWFVFGLVVVFGVFMIVVLLMLMYIIFVIVLVLVGFVVLILMIVVNVIV